ncbi:MAG TPA: hypothetical protein V6D35_20010 [Candidatus Sericytochromatia bacterium]|jgi:hypothetical protein
MTQISDFNEILESVEKLSVEDQKALLDVVQRRLVERRRAEIAKNIVKAQEEYQAGQVIRGTVDELMAELTK